MIPQSLFDHPTYNVVKPIKRAMVTALADCGLSRDQVVDLMNELADQYGVRLIKGNGKLTMDTFEKWLNVNDQERVINLKALTLFCAVTSSIEPLQVMVKPLGFAIVGDKDAKLLAWAKEYHKGKKAREAMKKIEADL